MQVQAAAVSVKEPWLAAVLEAAASTNPTSQEATFWRFQQQQQEVLALAGAAAVAACGMLPCAFCLLTTFRPLASSSLSLCSGALADSLCVCLPLLASMLACVRCPHVNREG